MALITIPTHPDADSYGTLEEADAHFENRGDVSDWDDATDDLKEAVLKYATDQIESMRFRYGKVVACPMYYRREQELKFPQNVDPSRTVTPSEVGSNYFKSTSLADLSTMPDDYWNNGCAIVTDGVGKGETYLITDFDYLTGKVTIDGSWTTTPNTSSSIMIVYRVLDNVKKAQFEQALYLIQGGGERQKLQAEGVVEFKLDELWEKYRDGNFNAGRMPICSTAKGYLRGLYVNIGKLLR